MSRKPKKSPVNLHKLMPFNFDPSNRSFVLEHKLPVCLHDPEQLPEEFRGTSPPSVGLDALCHIKRDGSIWDHEQIRPFIPEWVQVGFNVPEHKDSWLPSSQVGYELMWVGIDECTGTWPNATYKGKLSSIPVFIGPEMLQIDSTVTFQLRHVVKKLDVHSFDRPFVAIEVDSKPWLTVSYNARKRVYPLTSTGVRAAGRDMFDFDLPSRSYSSSVDFPDEYGCSLDIRVLLEGAFAARAEEFGDNRFTGVERGLSGAISGMLEGTSDAGPGKEDVKPT
jgi:hypothetical protein